MLALFLVTQELMQDFESSLAVLYGTGFLKFELVGEHPEARAVKADAAQDLQAHVKKSLMIDGPCEFNVSEVSRITLVVQISQARIIGSSIHRLAIDLGFVSSDPCGHLVPVHRNGLSHRVLPLLDRGKDTEMESVSNSK